jgi:two-component system, response regulator YesN
MYKVIIVDDEELFRKSFIKKVNWESYNIIVSGEAKDGLEALSLIKEVEPDIIFCDVKMPIKDGITLLKELLNIGNMKFIIISGYNDFEFTKQAVKYGAFDYILKPINDDEISGVLLRAVESLDNSVGKYNNQLMLNIDLRQKMVGKYESLIIHSTESRDIYSIEKYIDDFYDNLDCCPDTYSNSYTEFIILANKICNMFKLDFDKIIKKFSYQTNSLHSYNEKQIIPTKVKRVFKEIVDELICSKNSNGKIIIYEVIDYIASNYNQKLSLEIIAKRYFINPTYFSQLFKSVTNENFSTYLIKKRIEKAKELYRSSNLKMYQVANMVGYEDEKHFSQIFKKYVGLSPTEYKG